MQKPRPIDAYELTLDLLKLMLTTDHDISILPEVFAAIRNSATLTPPQVYRENIGR